MPLPRHHQLSIRADSNRGNIGPGVWIAIGALGVALIVLVFVVKWTRGRRASSSDPPLLLPKFLHKAWKSWSPKAYASVPTQLEQRHGSTATSSTHPPSFREPDDAVNRRISVRSIMTLPGYSRELQPNEQLIAREGERAGVDTVIEYPESDGEVETRREEEMSTLYNIRQARRREQSEREDRRRQRREARQAGDTNRLEELERESRQRALTRRNNDQSTLQRLQDAEANGELGDLPPADSGYLIAELASLRDRNARNRRVSSVSYAELGTARHDGSRIRAGSFESDNAPLMDSAASMGGRRSRAASRASSTGRGANQDHAGRPSTGHTRNTSSGGASYLSDDEDAPGQPTANNMLSPSGEQLPPNPPSYEDDISVHGGEAPPYESPVQTRNPPGFSREAAPVGQSAENGPQRRETGDSLRDEVALTSRYLERTSDSDDSSPTAETPSDSTGRPKDTPQHSTPRDSPIVPVQNSLSPETGPSQPFSAAKVPSQAESSTQKSPPLPKLQTDHQALSKPRIPPAIEINSATPVSSAPNSPRSMRSFRAER